MTATIIAFPVTMTPAERRVELDRLRIKRDEMHKRYQYFLDQYHSAWVLGKDTSPENYDCKLASIYGEIYNETCDQITAMRDGK